MSFDHRDPGTPEDAWARAGVLDRPRGLDLDGVGGLVVVAAHPDDETLGAGGLLHRLSSRGVPVTVLVATDGEAASPGSASSPEELRAVRRRELLDAVGTVAEGARVVLLGLPDGGLREHRDALRDAVASVVGLAAPAGAPLVVCAPWRGDGHRDHRIAGEVAAEVAQRHGVRLIEYPIWLWHWGDPAGDDAPWDAMRGLRLTDDEVDTKAKAVAAHASQTQAFSDRPEDAPVVGPEMVRHATRPVEVFVESEPVAEPSRSLDRGFFDRFYDGRTDPWGFESRWYEERKRAVLLASLPRRRFRHALELGCSTGVLTAELARWADAVVGVDIADAPLDAARRRLGPGPRLLRLDTPTQWPEGTFDLVVLSEVLYYYGRDDLDRTLDLAVGSLAADGVLVACHWRHAVPEYPLGGDEVQARVTGRRELSVLAHHEEEDFLLDVLVPGPPRSVAREAGLA